MRKITVYTSESSIRNPKVLIGEMWRDLMEGRELAWQLMVRDIRGMYRQSVLGLVWAFLLPLGNTVTWILLRNSGVVSVKDTDIPYSIYVFTGTMMWAIFLESIQTPLLKATASKSMFTKINFPREAIILSGFYQVVFNSLIKVLLMLVAALMLGFNPFTWGIMLFPLAILSLIMTGLTVGLLLTPIGLLYTDIGKGLPLIMQFLMYAVPVVYPIPQSKGIITDLITYNPITPLIVTSRELFAGLPLSLSHGFLYVNLSFLILFFVAWIIYRLSMPILIERMSS